MAEEDVVETPQRWTARRRAALVLSLLRGETSAAEAARKHGLIERFFRSLKEECVWQHTFADFAAARRAIANWIGWYNAARPHQALGYRSPLQFRAEHAQYVA